MLDHPLDWAGESGGSGGSGGRVRRVWRPSQSGRVVREAGAAGAARCACYAGGSGGRVGGRAGRAGGAGGWVDKAGRRQEIISNTGAIRPKIYQTMKRFMVHHTIDIPENYLQKRARGKRVA